MTTWWPLCHMSYVRAHNSWDSLTIRVSHSCTTSSWKLLISFLLALSVLAPVANLHCIILIQSLIMGQSCCQCWSLQASFALIIHEPIFMKEGYMCFQSIRWEVKQGWLCCRFLLLVDVNAVSEMKLRRKVRHFIVKKFSSSLLTESITVVLSS